MTRFVSKEDVKNPNRKRCVTPHVTGKVHIKTTTTCPSHARTVTIKRTDKKGAGKQAEKPDPHPGVGM